MSVVSILSRMIAGLERNVDLSANTLNVQALQVGASSANTLTAAIMANLITVQAGGDIGSTLHSHSQYPTSVTLAATGGSALIGDAGGYTNFTESSATIRGALQGIDSALASVVGDAANQTLSNLTSPTAINQDLIPSGGGTRVLGSATDWWNTLWVREILYPSQIDFRLDTGLLYNSTGSSVTDFSNLKLNDNSDILSINWQSRILADSAGATQLTWSTSGLSSASALNMNSNKIASVANGTASGDAVNFGQLSLYVPLTQVGAASGVASLDSGGKVPVAQLPSTVMEYQGAWDASTNTPTLTDGTGTNGNIYRASVAGTQTFGGVSNLYNVGDFIVYSGSLAVWQHSPGADGVSSVNSQTGAVVINAINQLTSDITAGPASGSQSVAATVAAIQGKAISGTTGTGNVVFSASPTITGTLTAAVISATSATLSSTLVATGNISGANLTASGHASLDLQIANNLSDVASAATAFANISPLTTAGDIIIEGAGPAPTRLAVGTTGQILTVVSGLPAWSTPTATPTNLSTPEISGVALTANTLVALRYAVAADSGVTAGSVLLATNDTTSSDLLYVVGLAYPTASVAIGGAVQSVNMGIINVPSHGFTVGMPLYLSTAGTLTSTAPTASLSGVVKVGQVRDANNIMVNIQIFGVN